jgi:asparagine synthase (glutamine-hydrolysing)
MTLSYKANRPLGERLRNQGLAGALGEVKAAARRSLGGFIRTIATQATGRRRLHATSLVNPQRRAELGAPDETLLTWRAADTRSERLAGLQRVDAAGYTKGALARWRIDERDPTADRRLVEFCLAVPDEQFRLGGIPSSLARRAIADRVPRTVLQQRSRGLQAADWHAGFSDPKYDLGKEIAKLAACRETARMLDIGAMRKAIEHWPSAGWHEAGVNQLYRDNLLRALSNGDFLRRAIAASPGATDSD